jgi:hypothetical protein
MLKDQEETIWLTLAELFFLDTEPNEQDFQHALTLLKDAEWTREKTNKVLVELIAPHYGANLGYLIVPVVASEWAGFDKALLVSKIRHSVSLREKYPHWYFMLSDWWCAKLLHSLDINRLLNRL